MLPRIFVALVTLSSFTVARLIDDGKYYLKLHWKEHGEKTSYARSEGDSIFMESTNHLGANQTWKIVSTHGGYSIQNVGIRAYAKSPGKEGDFITLVPKDIEAPTLWRIEPVNSEETAFTIMDPVTDNLAWTAAQTEEDFIFLQENTKTPNLQFWYITPA